MIKRSVDQNPGEIKLPIVLVDGFSSRQSKCHGNASIFHVHLAVNKLLLI